MNSLISLKELSSSKSKSIFLESLKSIGQDANWSSIFGVSGRGAVGDKALSSDEVEEEIPSDGFDEEVEEVSALVESN